MPGEDAETVDISPDPGGIGAEAGVCAEAPVDGFCTEAQPVLPSIAEIAPHNQYTPSLTLMTVPKECERAVQHPCLRLNLSANVGLARKSARFLHSVGSIPSAPRTECRERAMVVAANL